MMNESNKKEIEEQVKSEYARVSKKILEIIKNIQKSDENERK